MGDHTLTVFRTLQPLLRAAIVIVALAAHVKLDILGAQGRRLPEHQQLTKKIGQIGNSI